MPRHKNATPAPAAPANPKPHRNAPIDCDYRTAGEGARVVVAGTYFMHELVYLTVRNGPLAKDHARIVTRQLGRVRTLIAKTKPAIEQNRKLTESWAERNGFGSPKRDVKANIPTKRAVQAEQATAEDQGLKEIAVRIFEEAVHNLAMDEGDGLQALARKILRMRRDKAPHDEQVRLVKPLFFAIVPAFMEHIKTPDSSSEMQKISLNMTSELEAVLSEVRQSNAVPQEAV